MSRRTWWRLAAVLGLALALGLVARGRVSPSPEESATAPVCGKPAAPAEVYADSSPFNRPIAADARVHPNSDAMVATVVAAARETAFVLAVRAWTVPVYYADERTPRYDVPLTAEWAREPVLRGVPIPEDARPDPMADAHLAVVDRARGCEYDFWQARRSGEGWTASAGRRLPLDGPGVDPGGASARASGFGLLAGLIFPEELARGRIDHALVFSYPQTREGDPVAPATASDGWSEHPGAIPIGARLQLDPALDLDSLDLAPWERPIAEALQRYGMFLADTGEAVGLYAAHAGAYESSPYRGLVPDGDYAPLSGIPTERLRVLAPE